MLRVFPRILGAILLLQVLAQAVGIDLAIADAAQAEPCRACCRRGDAQTDAQAATRADAQAATQAATLVDDGDGRDCPPSCESCLCCGHHRPVMLPTRVGSQPTAPRPLALVTADEPALGGDANEIAHVPKRRAAV